MININTSRWESVRLLFDKRIIEVNPNTVGNLPSKEARPGQRVSAAPEVGSGQMEGGSKPGRDQENVLVLAVNHS